MVQNVTKNALSCPRCILEAHTIQIIDDTVIHMFEEGSHKPGQCLMTL